MTIVHHRSNSVPWDGGGGGAIRSHQSRQDKRITATDALKHPWMAGDASELEKRDLGPNMDKLRLFNARRKFKSAISSVRYCLPQ